MTYALLALTGLACLAAVLGWYRSYRLAKELGSARLSWYKDAQNLRTAQESVRRLTDALDVAERELRHVVDELARTGNSPAVGKHLLDLLRTTTL